MGRIIEPRRETPLCRQPLAPDNPNSGGGGGGAIISTLLECYYAKVQLVRGPACARARESKKKVAFSESTGPAAARPINRPGDWRHFLARGSFVRASARDLLALISFVSRFVPDDFGGFCCCVCWIFVFFSREKLLRGLDSRLEFGGFWLLCCVAGWSLMRYRAPWELNDYACNIYDWMVIVLNVSETTKPITKLDRSWFVISFN